MELIIAIIVIAVGWGIYSGIQQQKMRAQLLDSFNGTHAGWDTYVSALKQIVSISPDGSEVALGNATTPTLYLISALATVEILKDGASLTQTNRGSQAAGALIGGLALGGAGLLLGGLSGSKRNTNTIHSISLKLIVDDRSNPVYTIEFFKSPSKKGTDSHSFALKEPIASAEKFHALLVTAMRKAALDTSQHAAQQSVGHKSAADELQKLWDLKQAGALTEDEFNAHKGRLLGPQLSAR
jgi:hypothetical protein